MTRIMDMMENAGEKKAKSERFITRFARYYTPTVCVLALLVAIVPAMLGEDPMVWIYRALTFLVLSCPCALVISIPLTIMSGIGCASSNGILIKGGNYLEMLSRIDTMAFDKTGTLTEGRFSVVDVVSDERSLIESVSFALESNSNHPLAKAICMEFGGSDLIVKDVKEIPGKGMSGMIGSSEAYAGNSRLMSDLGFDIDDPEGRSTIHVAYDGRYPNAPALLLVRHVWRPYLVAWTPKSEEEIAALSGRFDQIIFETALSRALSLFDRRGA